MARSKKTQEEVILSSARNAFAKFGFEKTTMTDIARGANLKKPSLYHYYSSKNDIFSEVIKQEVRELLDKMNKAAEAESSAEEKIKAFLFARYRHIKQKSNLYAISKENLHEMSPIVEKVRGEFMELEINSLTSLIELGVTEGHFDIEEPKLVAFIAIAALQGIDMAFWSSGTKSEIERGMKILTDIFFKGLRREI